MIFYLYILYSQSKDEFYIGQTSNLKTRLRRHNNKQVPSTKFGVPWRLMYTEEFQTRQEVILREQFLKFPQGWLTLKNIKNNFFRNVAQPG